MKLRISIAFFLFVMTAGICNVVWNTNKPRPCAVEVQVINSHGDATEISASGGSKNTVGRWWDNLTDRSGVTDVRATETNLGGSYREYMFTLNECVTEPGITLSGTFAEGNLCEPNGQGALLSAYENGTLLNVTQKNNNDGTCAYVVTR